MSVGIVLSITNMSLIESGDYTEGLRIRTK
jgi:hypothetical protein